MSDVSCRRFRMKRFAVIYSCRQTGALFNEIHVHWEWVNGMKWKDFISLVKLDQFLKS